MFLPEHHRLLMMAVFGYLAWVFLSTGTLIVGAGVMLAVEGRPEVAVLLPAGLFSLHVGVTALQTSGARRSW